MPTPKGKGRPPLCVNALTFGTMLALFLNDQGVTAADISEHTGLRQQTVWSYLRMFHKLKAVYICNWLPDPQGRYKTRVWALRLGDEEDMPKPAARGHAVRQKEYRIQAKIRRQLAQVWKEERPAS